MRDDAADWADEKPLRHRCGVPDYYGCRVCMNASDDPDEDEFLPAIPTRWNGSGYDVLDGYQWKPLVGGK